MLPMIATARRWFATSFLGPAEQRRHIHIEKLRKGLHFGPLEYAPPAARRVFNAAMDRALDLRGLDELLEAAAGMRNLEFLAATSRALDLTIRVAPEELERIPKTGRLIIAMNHPSGVVEMNFIERLCQRRPDLKLVLNKHLLEITRQAEDLVIPVTIFGRPSDEEKQRTRAAIAHTLESEGAVAILPAGVISRRQKNGRIEDDAWRRGFIYAARAHRAPVVPAFVPAVNNELFYRLRGIGSLAESLSLLFVFREYLGQRGRSFRMRIGEPLGSEFLQWGKELGREEIDELAQAVRARVYALRET
jgi:putative hemolysin